MFIVLEGLDGCGKSTVAKELKTQLELDGFNVVLTREPGGTETAEKIRDILLESNEYISPEAEAMLFAAARTIHTTNKIIPALERGDIVISERYLNSSIAYQAIGRKLGIDNIVNINDFGIKGFRPDLVIYLDIDPIVGMQRIHRDKDRMEKENIDFYNKCRAYFLTAFRNRVDASKSKMDVLSDCLQIIYDKINGER